MQAHLSDAEKRKLVTLSFTHARDVELQHTIASDDERIVAAVAGTSIAPGEDSDAGAGVQAVHTCTAAHQSAQTAAGLSRQRRPSAASQAVEDDQGRRVHEGARQDDTEQYDGDWLERIRAHDAALQARIAAQDGCVQNAYR